MHLNWSKSHYDCRSLFHFFDLPERKMIWIPLKERSRTLWSYAFSEKYSEVWERQLQNILITAVIDTEARLCELMNPKGAPLMWAGLWHSDSCKAKSEADSVSEIADFGIGRPSSITFDIRPQTDGQITSRKGFWWDPKKDVCLHFMTELVLEHVLSAVRQWWIYQWV